MVDSGASYLDGFEMSDLTMDCGLDDQPLVVNAPNSWPQSMCSAFWLAGRNIVIRRIRIVNFGTRAPVYINGVLGGISRQVFGLRPRQSCRKSNPEFWADSRRLHFRTALRLERSRVHDIP
jgi:hypothetical protein